MTRVRVSGVVPVALPPHEAFGLFTASGERAWAHGWDPRFPVAVDDETEPGTVFEVARGGHASTWVVASCVPGASIAYARHVPGDHAGLITVECDAAPDGTTQARVTYDLTALSEEGAMDLETFAAGYDAFMAHWRDAIAAAHEHP
jgi:hypothetical protein